MAYSPIADYFIRAVTALMFMMPAIPVDMKALDKWKTYTFEEQGFSIKMPLGPEMEYDESPPIPFFFVSGYAEDVSYIVSCGENLNSNSDPKALLDEANSELLELYTQSGSAVKYRRVFLNGHPGAELDILMPTDKSPEMRITSRMYITKERIYSVAAGYNENNPSRKAVRKFLRSFRLL
jgi:hypothetical protein